MDDARLLAPFMTNGLCRIKTKKDNYKEIKSAGGYKFILQNAAFYLPGTDESFQICP